MENVKRHFDLLGFKAKDKVTGYQGVITTVSFDLYGCIQVVLTPEWNGKDEKYPTGTWFDVTRLEIKNEERVMSMPDYDLGYISEGKKGPAEKPCLTK